MATLGLFLVFIGWLTAVSARLFITIKAFQNHIFKGILCLLFVGYIIVFATNKKTRQTKALLVWLFGFVTFVIGLIIIP
jgi:formate/nitrite transporter FocA (FNT family)